MVSGMCEFPVAYVVLCVRFAHPPLFACAAVETACNALQGTQHSIRVVGQTLRSLSLNSSRSGLSPEKKRQASYLSHVNQTQVEIVLQEIIDDINSGTNDKAVIERLLNLVESLVDEKGQLTKTVQQLNDEINHLKGEQGKPEFTSSKKDGDISSEEERKNAEDRKPKSKNAPRNRNPKQSKIKIDRYEICRVDKKELPEDAIFKGHKDYVVQDIIIKTENVKYSREVYYSPSKKKYYYGQLPIEVKGEFGPGIRTLIPVLKSECNMSETFMTE
jgi:hypothetical protein